MPREVPPLDSVDYELFQKFKALHDKELRKYKALQQEVDISEEEWEEFSQESTESTNLKAAELAKTLMDDGEYEELQQLAKMQITFDPKNAADWRAIAKIAGKRRREQRPLFSRVFLLIMKIVVPILIILVILGIIGNSLPKH